MGQKYLKEKGSFEFRHFSTVFIENRSREEASATRLFLFPLDQKAVREEAKRAFLILGQKVKATPASGNIIGHSLLTVER